MKSIIMYFVLAWIPITMTHASTSSDARYLEGLWYDYSTDTYLEIKDHRKGIKAREIYRNRKKGWDTYNRMGRGVFDNCDGRAIIVLDRGQIQWKTGRRGRGIILERAYQGRGRAIDYDRYNDQRRYGDTRYNSLSRSYSYSCDQYLGNWYNADRRLYLEIIRYGNGFRARRPGNEWIYYERDQYNNYRDNRGNRYYFDNNELCWESSDRNDRYRFSKR